MRNMKFGFEESDEEKDDTNPDWADAIEKSGLGDKLREMNELQLEGADVYMSTFSQLKSYPFFRDISNWFYPFDKQQSDVIKEFRHRGKEGGSLLEIILQSGVLSATAISTHFSSRACNASIAAGHDAESAYGSADRRISRPVESRNAKEVLRTSRYGKQPISARSVPLL